MEKKCKKLFKYMLWPHKYLSFEFICIYMKKKSNNIKKM